MITEQNLELLAFARMGIMKIMKNYVDHVTILAKHAMGQIITNASLVKTARIEI
jgi:hypothetical protein